MIRKVVFDNKIRVVAERIPSAKSVAIGLWVNIGSRDEARDEHGLSHFLEHLFFKGTSRRSASEIAREIDAIGGEFNAYTSCETTTFYARVLEEHLPKAIELLSDNFHHSKFDAVEIDRERQVVLEEIKMVEDDPEDLVQTLHTEEIFKGHPLGRSILGTPETLANINRKKIVQFLKRTYDPAQIILSVAGRFKFEPLFAFLNESFGGYTASAIALSPRTPPAITPCFTVKKRKLEQVHLCISTPGLAVAHPQREALHILHTVLGGSISSRLFQEVREQRGLAYSIYSSISSYQDGGLFTIYAGTGVQNAPRVVDLIYKAIRKLRTGGISAEEMRKAKEHLKGSLLLGMEGSSSRMNQMAREEIYFKCQFRLEEIIRRIQRVNLRQIHDLAETLFDLKTISLTALGPIEAHALPAPHDA